MGTPQHILTGHHWGKSQGPKWAIRLQNSLKLPENDPKWSKTATMAQNGMKCMKYTRNDLTQPKQLKNEPKWLIYNLLRPKIH